MMLFLVSLIVILLMIGLMAIGVWLGKREPLKGTCGGLNRLTGDRECPVCGGDTAKCEAADGKTEREGVGAERPVEQWRP